MAYALISHFAAAGANTFTSGSQDTSGATLIVVGITENGTGAAVLSDNKSNTWTRLTQQDAIPGFSQGCLAYAKNPTVGTGHTFTLTGSSIFAVESVAWFSGANTTAPFDQQNTGGGAGATTGQTPGSVTPSEDNELVVSNLAWVNSITITSVTGMTLLDQTNFSGGNNYGGGLAYVIQTTAGAINPAWNWTGGPSPANAGIATFKAAAAGATTWGPLLGLANNRLVVAQ